MATSIRDKIEAALEGRGWARDHSVRGRHKHRWTHPSMDAEALFLGANGACRRGSAVSRSRPVSETEKSVLIVEGEAILRARRRKPAEGIATHKIKITVEGGDPKDVAEAIAKRKTA